MPTPEEIAKPLGAVKDVLINNQKDPNLLQNFLNDPGSMTNDGQLEFSKSYKQLALHAAHPDKGGNAEYINAMNDYIKQESDRTRVQELIKNPQAQAQPTRSHVQQPTQTQPNPKQTQSATNTTHRQPQSTQTQGSRVSSTPKTTPAPGQSTQNTTPPTTQARSRVQPGINTTATSSSGPSLADLFQNVTTASERAQTSGSNKHGANENPSRPLTLLQARQQATSSVLTTMTAPWPKGNKKLEEYQYAIEAAIKRYHEYGLKVNVTATEGGVLSITIGNQPGGIDIKISNGTVQISSTLKPPNIPLMSAVCESMGLDRSKITLIKPDGTTAYGLEQPVSNPQQEATSTQQEATRKGSGPGRH